MNNKSLVILAAGMGSRYGGLKQIDGFGPNGESIIDYSIYDAINAGFKKIVFIIRESFKQDFEKIFIPKIGDKCEVHFVSQELENIPKGLSIPSKREKPWGTAHAVLVAKDVIDEPFLVINADDYYGKRSYELVADFFNNNIEKEVDHYCCVGYKLENTLSEYGAVNRGICEVNDEGNLENVVETLKIEKIDDHICYPEKESKILLEPDTIVSMNMWGFTPSFFKSCEEGFVKFFKDRGNELKSEYFIPLAISEMIEEGKTVKVPISPDEWFGVTYQEDKPHVMDKIKKMLDEELYPSKLWE